MGRPLKFKEYEEFYQKRRLKNITLIFLFTVFFVYLQRLTNKAVAI